MNGWTVLFAILAGATALAYRRANLRTCSAVSAVLLILWVATGTGSRFWTGVLIATTVLPLLLSLDHLRRDLITRFLFKWYRRVLPPLSDTENEAIAAGTVWWDGDLFTGEPDWNKLLASGAPKLTEEEQAFLDGPVMDACRMVDPWKVNHDWAGIPADVMDHLKEHGFLGLIIPKEFGGRELSAVAQSAVLVRLLSIGSVVGNFVMVPNSLGPGELLVKYGTEEQKQHYLPRLAAGEDIPCFALTAPLAGSDATAIPDTGIVCKGQWEGNEIIGMRLTFDKRYITLAPVATLIGLAFQLQDPDHLMGKVDDYGITCALIPRDTPGVEVGNRHDPVGDPFYNGTVRGRDVFVPLDCIIGGQAMAGKGWRMLVSCLSAGRAISLPSASASMAKRALAGAGAYARVRRQFNTSIANFEGIQKPLARIAGLTYIINAGCVQTCQAVAKGARPSVPSAILKYHCTEMARQVVNDAMDIHGGKAVMRGPSNYLAAAYEGMPVAITVEGANILTRNLMIFGQGAMRSHPYVLREMDLARREYSEETLREFDRLFMQHIGFVYHNAAAAFVHGLTRSSSVRIPTDGNPRLGRYYQHLSRFSAAFAAVADVSMLMMQSSLKRREMLSARLGDLLSMLYLGSMVLKHYEGEGCPPEDTPVVHWSMNYLLHRYQEAMHGLLENFPNRLAALKLRLLVFPTGRHYEKPSDDLERKVAELVSRDTPTRRRLMDGIYLEATDHNPLGRLNDLLAESNKLESLQKKLREAVKAGKVNAPDGRARIDAAEQAGVVTEDEAAQLRDYDERLMAIINVDEFDFDDLAREEMPSP